MEFTIQQIEGYTQESTRFYVTMVWVVLLIVSEVLKQVILFKEGRAVKAAEKDSDFVKVKDGVV